MRLPDAYQVQPTMWGGQIRTPVVGQGQAGRPPAALSATPSVAAVQDMIAAIGQDRTVVFVAGATAACCGRLTELAITNARGRTLFHEYFAAGNGERTRQRGLQMRWPCADLHPSSSAPASHWARQFHAALRYRDQSRAIEPSYYQRKWGHLRSGVVFWGLDLATAVIRELGYCNGQPRNGRPINVRAGMADVPLIDLQQLDLAWRHGTAPAESLPAHLPPQDPLEQCRLMREHLEHMATGRSDATPRLPLGPHRPLTVPARPTAGERQGWPWHKDTTGRTATVTTPTSGIRGRGRAQAGDPPDTDTDTGGRGAGQGWLPDPKERRAVELHAVAMAVEHFAADGWSVRDVGNLEPYDLHLTRGHEYKIVEVKGTTSTGEEVQLTPGEVDVQRDAFPHNALFIVHSIELDRSGDAPQARGGIPGCDSPWLVEDDRLKKRVIYTYRTFLSAR